MNVVNLIGRLTRDPEVRYVPETQMAVARFTLAVDRQKRKSEEKPGTDFPSVVCFGKTAELIEKYVSKGRQIAVQGKIQTGSYEKEDGTKVYTTDVIADRVEFLGSASSSGEANHASRNDSPVAGFEESDDDIPF